MVHVLTQKGRGYEPARQDEADQFHAVGVINPETGLPFEIAGRSWTDEFSDAMVEIGAERRDVVGRDRRDDHPGRVSVPSPRHYPDRIIDVGIAEQHAVTMASGYGVCRAPPGRRGLCDLPQSRLRSTPHGRRPPSRRE
jgi:1-deoxy-D-xylulose-5-phosphate synthase